MLSEDSCIITIGFYTAPILQLISRKHLAISNFCEDLDDASETVFVLDYLHKSLSEVAVDFRIIRNVTDKGEYVQIEDINLIENIDLHTVFYQPPIIKENASYMVTHVFNEPGNYVGIVTAGHPSKPIIYSSVFPFCCWFCKYSMVNHIFFIFDIGIWFLCLLWN